MIGRMKMRQKYRICQMQKEKTVSIQEFAVIEKDTKNVDTVMLRDNHFDLICEQNYDYETIAQSAKAGHDELMETIRTPNLYPIGDYAAKIAESVIALISDESDRCIELFFDDNEMAAGDMPATAD